MDDESGQIAPDQMQEPEQEPQDEENMGVLGNVLQNNAFALTGVGDAVPKNESESNIPELGEVQSTGEENQQQMPEESQLSPNEEKNEGDSEEQAENQDVAPEQGNEEEVNPEMNNEEKINNQIGPEETPETNENESNDQNQTGTLQSGDTEQTGDENQANPEEGQENYPENDQMDANINTEGNSTGENNNESIQDNEEIQNMVGNSVEQENQAMPEDENDSNEPNYGNQTLPENVGMQASPEEEPTQAAPENDESGANTEETENQVAPEINEDNEEKLETKEENTQETPENEDDDQNMIQASPEENGNNDEDTEGQVEDNEQANDDTEEEPSSTLYQTDGMTIMDDLSTQRQKNPGVHSVSHLPPLETSPELDAQSEKFLNRFLEKGKLPPQENRMQLVQYVQRQKVNAVVQNKFVEAAKFQGISQQLNQALIEAQFQDQNQQKIDALELKLDETKDRISHFNKETTELTKDLQEKLTQRRYQLETHQEEELNKFEDQWNDEEFLVKFAKPSSYLLQVKKIERSLVLTKNFERAEDYRKKVNELEKEESEGAQRRAETEMKKLYQKILKKHETELEQLEDYSKRTLDLLAKDREITLQSLIARQNKLEAEIESLQQISKQPATLPPLVATRTLEKTGGDVMTPRTIQRYSAYKTNIHQPKLKVRPLGIINQKKKKKATHSDF